MVYGGSSRLDRATKGDSVLKQYPISAILMNWFPHLTRPQFRPQHQLCPGSHCAFGTIFYPAPSQAFLMTLRCVRTMSSMFVLSEALLMTRLELWVCIYFESEISLKAYVLKAWFPAPHSLRGGRTLEKEN